MKARQSLQLDFWPELASKQMSLIGSLARRAPARSGSEDGRTKRREALKLLCGVQALPDGNHGDITSGGNP